MLRFLRSKIPAGHHEARQRDKDEFFEFAKTVHHGFPAKPSCVAYDPELNLLALGTKTGYVKIYGGPGVEFVGQHDGELPVLQLFFLPNQGRIISLCENQTFHLWEVNFRDGRSFLDHVREVGTEGRLKPISSCVLRKATVGSHSENATEGDNAAAYSLLIGTESGNVYSLDTKTLELTDYIIYQDAVIQNIPDDYKVNPGPVESISVHPTDPHAILLGYNRGLIVYWDGASNCARQTYVSQQGVESVCWHRSGEKFASAHNDGSYMIWSARDSTKPMQSPNMPYGPFPCRPIDKLIWKPSRSADEDLTIFTGGMPRASYGDRNTVAVKKGMSKEIVLDFTSKVLDFLTLDMVDNGESHALVVLCEEELVVVDLLSDDWHQFRLPYLIPVHASPITAAQHVKDVAEDTWTRLKEAGESQSSGKFKYSGRDWPIQGGRCNAADLDCRDVLITGHEDGTIKFWAVGGPSMGLLYVLNTAKIFAEYNDPRDAEQEEEEWPPFKKIGCYDPFSDDPRYGIQRLWMDPCSGLLVVGGTAGQTMIWESSSERKQSEVNTIEIPIVTDQENFVWKGHDKVAIREGPVEFYPGYAVKMVVQSLPPASVTALCAQPEWGVVGIGTAHGFTLFDYVQKRPILTKCLINPNDVAVQASAMEGTIARLKSFKKSVRDSFRRRRRRANRAEGEGSSPTKEGEGSPKKAKSAGSPTPPASPSKEGGEEKKEEANVATTSDEGATAASSSTEKKEESPKKKASPKKESPKKVVIEAEGDDVKPVERAIEARGESPLASTEQLASLVRSLYFAKTYVLNTTTLSPSFWVGTNGGAVKIHLLTLPEDGEKRATEELKCELAKEIQLQHRAPVLGMIVVDGRDFALGFHPPVGVETPTPTEATAGHRLIVCSEEQLKSFQLPTLKPGRSKYKLTAIEGARIRKVEAMNLQSKSDENKWEAFMMVMSNQGEVHAFSVHSFRRYLKAQCMKSTDISGVLSTVLSRRGEGFYLRSSSEWQRFAVGAKAAIRPDCSLDLPEGARPPPPAPPVEEKAKKDEEPKEEGERPADASGLSADNSVLPSDMTVDSIRDYTQQTVESHTEKVASGETVVVKTKTTKTTVIKTSGGDEIKTEIKETKELVNGEGEDEIAKLKAMNIQAANDGAHEPVASQ